MAAIARRVIRDMIATTVVATTPTAGAVVIPAAVAMVVTARVAIMGAAVIPINRGDTRPPGEVAKGRGQRTHYQTNIGLPVGAVNICLCQWNLFKCT
jgi:hypothetical protein